MSEERLKEVNIYSFNDENYVSLQDYTKLQQQIDNAIWLLDLFISDTDLSRYDILKILMDVKKKLKGKDVK